MYDAWGFKVVMNTRIRNHLGRTTITLNQEDYGTKFMEH